MAAAGHTHVLFKNSIVEIQKIEDTNYIFTFNIEKENTLYLIRSLFALGINMKKTNETSETIEYDIECDSIQSMNQYRSKKKGLLKYLEILRCSLTIGEQIKEFEKNEITTPYIDIDNIIVIDSEKFIYMNEEYLNIEYETQNKNEAIINIEKLYEKQFLMGNELFNIKSIPAKINSKDWIFSLGILCIYLLTNKEDSQNKTVKQYSNMIEMIQDTKLYFFILRCLEENPKKRKYLFI